MILVLVVAAVAAAAAVVVEIVEPEHFETIVGTMKPEHFETIVGTMKIMEPEHFETIVGTMNQKTENLPMPCKAQQKAIKIQVKQEVSPEEQEKRNWMKGARATQATLQREHNTIMNLKLRATQMQHDRLSGVSRELLESLQKAQIALMSQYEIMTQVLVAAEEMSPDTFNPDTAKLQKAKEILENF